ncbi:hypothetical protein LTR62_008119 [Meristemomyces frigidus]|uniref:Uncharacterized protein n=1 Tax=Meristemomyces frigidus TaxID=1508187 RepID=A0AAN7YNH9_9PEZI|nr:hypothetical protein LTR62_008119 [Meristemomyces frigidus]
MVSAQSSSEGNDEYHSLSAPPSQEPAGDDETGSVMEPPIHPLPTMQGAFEESIKESAEDYDTELPFMSSDAQVRRQYLLEAHQYDDSWTSRWKQRATARYHPLLKLMAQIVFGMHLLQQGQAKSNGEVVKILQTHVSEVDTFLERTSEDFGLAIDDIKGRIGHLKLPLEHVDVFNSMLEDKTFRTQLLEGNAKIEKIIERTAKAMGAALTDLDHGLQATKELGTYLRESEGRWPVRDKSVADVHSAMQGNEQGWLQCLAELKAKGQTLGAYLIRLATLIGDMSRLAAAASRRSMPSRWDGSPSRHRDVSPSRSTRSLPATSSALRSKFATSKAPPMPAINKPLPREPLSKTHPVPMAQRFEQPRQSPAPSSRRVSSMPQEASLPRPKTAGGSSKSAGKPRDARQTDGSTGDLADFLMHSSPLRSNPHGQMPSPLRSQPPIPSPLRSNPPDQSFSRASVVGQPKPVQTAEARSAMARSKNHSAAVIQVGRRDSRATTRSSTQGMDGILHTDARKDSVTSPGLGRRMSTRLKNLRLNEEDEAQSDTTVPTTATVPTDSAYSSGTETISITPHLAAPKTSTARPTSRLGLFPRVADPPAAAPPPEPSITLRKAPTATASIAEGQTRSLASSKPSKMSGFSLRNLFSRRDGS